MRHDAREGSDAREGAMHAAEMRGGLRPKKRECATRALAAMEAAVRGVSQRTQAHTCTRR